MVKYYKFEISLGLNEIINIMSGHALSCIFSVYYNM